MKAIRRQFYKFLIGGAVNTTATYGLFVALCQVISPSMAYTTTYLVGIVLSYVINAHFVFGARASLGSMLQFPGIYIVQYVVGLGVLNLLTGSGLDSRLAMLVVIIVSIPLTFVLTRIVFKDKGCTS